MGDQQHDTRRILEKRAQTVAREGVQVVGGFVEQQHRGTRVQCLCELPALPFTGREARPTEEAALVDAQARTQATRFAVPRLRERLECLTGRIESLRDVAHERGALDVSRGGPHQARGDAQERGLAGTVGPDERVDAPLEREIDVDEE